MLDPECGDVSPDGRRVSLIDYATGDLAVWDADVDSVRRVTDKGAWFENGSIAGCSTFSPDGGRIAYRYFVLDDAGEWGDELRVVEAAGSGGPRLIARLAPGHGVDPTDWGEAGILGTVWPGADSLSRIVLVDPDDGAVRPVLELRGEPPSRATFSPDGRTIAYGRGEDLRLVATDGTAGRPAGVRGTIVGWPERGRGLYFLDRAGDLRVLRIDDGRPVGEPEMVHRGGADQGIGASDEAVFTRIPLETARVHVVAIDGEGRPVGEPAPVTSLSEGRGGWPAWSPDGRTLAYVQRDRIRVTTPDGSLIRELPITSYPGHSNLTWGPDGRSLWYRAPGDSTPAIHRYAFRTGATEKVLEPAGGMFFALDPVRSVIYTYRPALGNDGSVYDPQGIYAYDYDSGSGRLVVEVEGSDKVVSPIVSPDGSRLAYRTTDPGSSGFPVIMTVPTAGGPPREVHRLDRGSGTTGVRLLGWSPDGRRLLYGRREVEDAETLSVSERVLESVAVEGGEPTVIARFPPEWAVVYLALHLESRRMAFRSGSGRYELWKTEVGEGGRQ